MTDWAGDADDFGAEVPMLIELAYNPSQPRDSHGKWCGTGIRPAVRALMDRHAGVIGSMPDTGQYDDWGFPHNDPMSKIGRVSGNVIRYHGNLGIDRADMPQLSGSDSAGNYHPSAEMGPRFDSYLASHGVSVQVESVPASSLHATQTTGDARTIAGIAKNIAAGESTKPIFVSADGRVLDGHHTWAAHAITGTPVPVRRANVPINRLLVLAHRFGKENDIQRRAVGVAANPMYARAS